MMPKKLIKRLLNVNYRKRPSAKEALKDVWFQNVPKKQINPSLLKSAMKDLRAMSFSSKLQQATMQLMIQNLMPKEEEDRLRTMFI